MSAETPVGTRDYHYKDARPNPSHRYLWPTLEDVVRTLDPSDRRAIDVGCGNGSTSDLLHRLGYRTIGVDGSAPGVTIAQRAFPDVEFHMLDATSDLAARFGRFPLVVALEVIEHMFDPRAFVKRLYELVEEGGTAVVSTPYHGYWKDLAVALAGRWEAHHQPLSLGGHVKFFGAATLRRLLTEEGFSEVSIRRVGRSVPALAMSMVAVARR
jgi:2-polyprenyl-6-hydroxyphenyl methylase/3-demethylubiquinone-9 3-methyltransferase